MNWKASLQTKTEWKNKSISLRSKGVIQTWIKWTTDHMKFKFPAKDKFTRTGHKWKRDIRYKGKLVHGHRRA